MSKVGTLSSNKKFGYFFTLLSLIGAIYYLGNGHAMSFYVLLSVATMLFALTLLRASWLRPLNIAWMQLGEALGKIVSPIVLGLLYFLLFVPISIMFWAFGRDELRIKFQAKRTHWIIRDPEKKLTQFEQQY